MLSDPVLLERYSSADDVDVLSRPWTRSVFPRTTTGPDGRDLDLMPYLAKNRPSLVLEPNRSYGGYGVVVGAAVDDATWARAVNAAATQRAEIPVIDVPVDDGAGAISMEPFYVVMGFAPSRYGLAILGRASQKQVVNVAQRGGIVPVVVAHGAKR